MSLDKVMMPVPDGHPDVFDLEWPLRVADIDRDGDIDIIGANWDTKRDPNGAPMEMWRNLLSDRRN